MNDVPTQSRDRASGLAFIIGSIGFLVTMMIHPTGPDLFAPGRMSHAILLGILSHGLALCSIPVIFLAALGLSLRVRPAGILPIAALVVFGFAMVAVMNAATFSGFVAPEIARQIAAPNADPFWRAAFRFNGQLNQAFALIYVLGASAAILLWSVWMLRSAGRTPGIFIYGAIMAPLTMLVTVSGHIHLDVHGFGAIVVGQAIWFIGVGIWLRPSPGVLEGAR